MSSAHDNSHEKDIRQSAGEASPHSLGRYTKREFLFCYAEDDYAYALALMAANSLSALPVLDAERRLIGMLTRNDGKCDHEPR